MSSARRLLLSPVRYLRDLLALAAGICVYWAKRATPAYAYQAMIRLFCRSSGRSNDLMTGLVRLTSGLLPLPAPRGDLGVVGNDAAARVAESIERDGYYVFKQTLPEDTCRRLLQFAQTTPAIVRPTKDQLGARAAPRREVYERGQPRAVRYDFAPADLLRCRDVQALMANPTLLAVAQRYLGSAPLADVVAMWWHTAYSDQPDEEAAQFFHFDMDRIKWLKFFVYLTDVRPENGPHCFVRGSHRSDGIPAKLLSRGYARLTDEEVAGSFPRDRFVEFLAPRGTVIAEDSRGLHKGRHVARGDRLMLQVQFSNSLFGCRYEQAEFGEIVAAELADMVRLHPGVYRNYLRPHAAP
jgi:hypothetical protein